MDFLLIGLLLFVLGSVLALVLPGNRTRVLVNLVCQAVACGFVLYRTIPVLFGGESLSAYVQWSYPVERIDVRLDALSAFFLTFSLPMTFLGSVYAVGYLAQDIRGPRQVGTHFALLSTVQISFLIVYTVQNSFAFLVGWEMAALSAWLLVIWNHRDQKIRFAGFNYLISTHLSLLFLVAAVMILHGETNSFQFADYQMFLSTPGTRRGLTFVLLMTSFGLKSAFFPFHTWLPRAHSAAPAHVSALMSGVIHKAGLFGVLKFIILIGKPDPWMGWFLLIVSAMSAFVGVLYTITQRDIKRMLGYSSTENVGIAGMGFGMGCIGLSLDQPILVAFGFGGGILHILNHALFKCLLFYGAGSIYRFTHTIDLEKLGGLIKVMKWTAPLFLLGSLASAAMPALNGFVSEFLIYFGLLHPGPELGAARIPMLLAAATLALVGGLSALSVTRSFGLIFLGLPRDPHHVVPAAKENPLMVLPMAIHLIGILLIGLLPSLGLAVVAEPTALLLSLAGSADRSLTDFVMVSVLQSLTLVSLILVGLFAFLAGARFALFPHCERRHVTWGCGYTRPNPRMQYTGSSFSHPMVVVFRDLLRYLRRDSLPKGPFPADGKLETHCVDSVEYSVFNALQIGERLVESVLHRVPETSRASIGLGLAALILLVVILLVK